MLKDLIRLVSRWLTDSDRLNLKLCGQDIYFKFINKFKKCCKNNYIISIKILSLTKELNWNEGLSYACLYGYRDLVDFLIENGAHFWTWGLESACEGGHLDLAKLMIEKDIDTTSTEKYSIEYLITHLNIGFSKACLGGHRNIIDLMIKLDTDTFKGSSDIDWDFGLRSACEGGHRDIVDLMISKGANNWEMGLWGACKGGWLDIVNLIIRHLDTSEVHPSDWSWNWGLYLACESGSLDIVNLIISKGANDWDGGLIGACSGGHIDIINLMIDKGANAWNRALDVVKWNRSDIIDLLREKEFREYYLLIKPA